MAEDENAAAANSPVTKAEFNCLLAAMEGVQEQIHTMLSAEREATDKRLAKKTAAWFSRRRRAKSNFGSTKTFERKSPQLQIPSTPRLLQWNEQKRH